MICYSISCQVQTESSLHLCSSGLLAKCINAALIKMPFYSTSNSKQVLYQWHQNINNISHKCSLYIIHNYIIIISLKPYLHIQDCQHPCNMLSVLTLPGFLIFLADGLCLLWFVFILGGWVMLTMWFTRWEWPWLWTVPETVILNGRGSLWPEVGNIAPFHSCHCACRGTAWTWGLREKNCLLEFTGKDCMWIIHYCWTVPTFNSGESP